MGQKRFIKVSRDTLGTIFHLPCVKMILKSDEGDPIIILKPELLETTSRMSAIVLTGDILEETQDHTWKVLRIAENIHKVNL